VDSKPIKLEYFEEAYTTERWLVRIYKVLPLRNRTPGMKSRFKMEELKTFKPFESRWRPIEEAKI